MREDQDLAHVLTFKVVYLAARRDEECRPPGCAGLILSTSSGIIVVTRDTEYGCCIICSIKLSNHIMELSSVTDMPECAILRTLWRCFGIRSLLTTGCFLISLCVIENLHTFFYILFVFFFSIKLVSTVLHGLKVDTKRKKTLTVLRLQQPNWQGNNCLPCLLC